MFDNDPQMSSSYVNTTKREINNMMFLELNQSSLFRKVEKQDPTQVFASMCIEHYLI